MVNFRSARVLPSDDNQSRDRKRKKLRINQFFSALLRVDPRPSRYWTQIHADFRGAAPRVSVVDFDFFSKLYHYGKAES